MKSPRIYVVAGDADEARSYLVKRGLSRSVAVCVSSESRVMGIPMGSRVILTGTFERRADWPALKDRLDASRPEYVIAPL